MTLCSGHEGVAGVGCGRTFQKVTRQLLAVELDLDPDARPGLGVEGGGHAVVERPVQVRQRGFDQHPGHRQVRGQGRPGRLRGGGGKALEQGKLLGFAVHATGRIGTHGWHLPSGSLSTTAK